MYVCGTHSVRLNVQKQLIEVFEIFLGRNDKRKVPRKDSFQANEDVD